MINYQLCKEFPALSPFDVDARRYADVIKLYSSVIDLNIDRKFKSDPNRVVRRPAGDNWF